MTDKENVLVGLIKSAVDAKNENVAAMILQSYIAENGFLSEEAGNMVKTILADLREIPQ